MEDAPLTRTPLVVLNPDTLTVQELRRLYDAGFRVPVTCRYCGDAIWEPHYGCDARLKAVRP